MLRMATLRRWLALGVLAFVLVPATARAAEADASAKPEDQIVLSGSVTVPRGKEAGEIVVFHGSATIAGVARGDVVVLDGPIVVNGQVSGSVIAVTGDVTLGPGAQVLGDVKAGGTVAVDASAKVSGGVRDGVDWTLRGALDGVARFVVWLALAVSTLLLLVALVLVAPRGADAVHLAVTTGPWASAGWGLGALVGLPVLAVLLVVSVLGMPLGLTLLLALAFVLFVGFALSAWVVGRLLWRPPRSRWLALLFGWLVASAVLLVPYAGGTLWVVGSGFGLGAAIVATWRARGHRGRHRPGLPSAEAWTGSIEGEVGL
jgi:hypothetical protein